MKKTILAALAAVLTAAGVQAADHPGKALYDAKCASCHGKDGKGNPAMVKMFKTDLAALDMTDKATLDKKDEALYTATAKGVNKMPAFETKMKEAEIKNVLAYVRTLAPAPAAGKADCEKAPEGCVDAPAAPAAKE